MGRIDAVLQEDLEKRFRMEVANRYGVRKGNMLRAISEAIELWTATDKARSDAKKLGKTVRNPRESNGIKQHAVELLASMGVAGRDVLTDIGVDTTVPDSIREQALKALKAHADR
ncbi:MAG: hypothetical protein L3K18_03545 [Thermoplasmata archaeon]|nr:hypothetical protein [Thermoplasmata archaeon]